MARRKRDLWELEDELPPPWYATIAKRADDLDAELTTETRWALYAVRSVVDEIVALPEAFVVRWIALAGTLANGVIGERIHLAVIVKTDTPEPQKSVLWSALNALLVDAERMYAQKFDCLFLTEEEIGHPTHPPVAWLVIAHDHLIVWP